MRTIGTSAYSLRCGILKQGDPLEDIVVNTVLNSGLEIKDKDIIFVTESVVSRCAGLYVTLDEVMESVKRLSNNADKILIDQPVYSRNRFAMILKAIARATGKEVFIYMPPYDEVGNPVRGHMFTHVDYDTYYKDLVESEGKKCTILYQESDWALKQLDLYHTYRIDARMWRTTKDLDFDLSKECALQHICADKCEWGMQGSNKSSEELLKLFPSKELGDKLVENIQKRIFERTGKKVFAGVFGDGAYKCPTCGVWECLDPLVSPSHSPELNESANEIKIKNFADEKFANLHGEELNNAIKEEIKNNKKDLKGNPAALGTTPRAFCDLIGSLSDLLVASGSKGCPITYISGYFDDYADD